MVAGKIASATRRNFSFNAQSSISSSAHTMAGVSVGDSVKRDEDGQSEESSESKKKIKEIRGKNGRRAFLS